MTCIQFLPILLIDLLSSAFFGLSQANNASTQIIPLFISASLYAVFTLVCIFGLIYLPSTRKSTILILFLCLLRVCEFSLVIVAKLTSLSPFVVTQVWLGSLEYIFAIFLLVRIPAEYFAHVDNTYFPAYEEHKEPSEDVPLEGKHFLVEGPAVAAEETRAPLAASGIFSDNSGGFTEIYFKEDESLSSSAELPRQKPNKSGRIRINSSPPDTPTPDSEEPPSLKRQPIEFMRPPHLLLFLEKSCVLVICIASMLVGSLITVYVHLYPLGDPFMKVLLYICIWANLGFGLTLLLVEVVKLQKMAFAGHFFGSSHSHGLVLIIALGGWVYTFAESFARSFLGTPLDSLPNPLEDPFVTCARAVFTQLLPLGFHFYNVISDRPDKRSNIGMRVQVAYFLVVANLHWMVVGYTLAHGDLSTTAHALATCARAAALASALDFCFVITALLSPLVHSLLHVCNLGALRLSLHAIHAHRDTVVRGSIFALCHVILHVIAWVVDPSLSFPASSPSSPLPSIPLHRAASVPYISGLVMMTCLIGSGITGHALTARAASPRSSLLHLPLSLLFFVAFFVHGYERIMGSPLGDYAVLGTFLICTGSYLLFFFVFPIRRTEVDFRHSTWGEAARDPFLFLSIKFGNASTISPGSFFTIYGNYGSLLDFTHGHPFPVFSSKSGNLEFLVHCRTAKHKDRITFTQQLLTLRPDLLYIQGPFRGPASPFLESLANLSSPVHLFLCGWNTGFANVFAILEHLKDHGPNYAIKSISCIFNRLHNAEVQRKLHSRVGALVFDWESPIPVSIIETIDKNLRHVVTIAERQNKQIFKNKQELMEMWRESMGGCNRWVVMKEGEEEREEDIEQDIFLGSRKRSGTFGDSGKVLYFCGNDFLNDYFDEGWMCFVENMPF